MDSRIGASVERLRSGARLGAGDALDLYRHAPTHELGRLADAVRAAKHPDRIVTYIIDRNVNYTTSASRAATSARSTGR